jgi:hypothetical protein
MYHSITTRIAGESDAAYRSRANAKLDELHQNYQISDESPFLDGLRLIGPNVDAYVNLRGK